MQTKHTPTPLDVFDHSREQLRQMFSDSPETFAYVVRCVNAHEELIKALSYYATGSTDSGKWAKKAIAKAEGRTK